MKTEKLRSTRLSSQRVGSALSILNPQLLAQGLAHNRFKLDACQNRGAKTGSEPRKTIERTSQQCERGGRWGKQVTKGMFFLKSLLQQKRPCGPFHLLWMWTPFQFIPACLGKSCQGQLLLAKAWEFVISITPAFTVPSLGCDDQGNNNNNG